jgi:phenylacetate-CoA ligase
MGSNFLTLVRVLLERRAQERSCRWTRAQLESHQTRSVAALRNYALAHSPFYRAFHRGFETRPLQELPILTKGTLMEHFDDLVTDRRLRLADLEDFLRSDGSDELYLKRYVVLATSGSTGRRGVFVFDDQEWIRAVAAITRPIAWAQPPGASRRPPRAALIASAARWHYSARVGQALANRIAPALRLDAAMPVDELVTRLNAWQPQALATYPSVLRQLAAEQSAGRLQIPLRNIATSAEVLTADVRAAVRRAWSIPVQDTYGATEYAPIASECSLGHKHLFENGAIIEIADARGEPVPPGEVGERVLLTVFGRRIQPLIRYEISDLVRVSGESCACGRPYRVIESVDGREEDVLHFEAASAGRPMVAVHPNRFHEALEGLAVEAWQVKQGDSDLTIRLLGPRAGDLCAAAEIAVRAAIASTGARVPSVVARRESTLERGATGKAPLIVARKPHVLEATSGARSSMAAQFGAPMNAGLG